jgi:Flp pilus assembly protein TadD
LHLSFIIESERGRGEVANRRLAQSILADPKRALPWTHHAVRWRATDLANGSEELATLHAGRAELSKPGHVAALKVRANALKHADLAEDRLAVLERLVHLTPGLIEAHRELAELLRQQTRTSEAESALSRAIHANPTDAVLVRDLAGLQIDAGRPADAERTMLQAVGRGLADANLIVTVAEIQAQRGQLGEAMKMLRGLDDKDRLSNSGHQLLALMSLHTGQDKPARLHFKRAAEGSKHQIDRTILTGMMHMAAGEPTPADQCFGDLQHIGAARIAENYRASTADMMRVSADFHAALEHDDPIPKLTEMRWLCRLENRKHVLLLTIDAGYFRRYQRLIERNLSLPNRPAAHLHLIDTDAIPDAELIEFADTHDIALTVEKSGCQDHSEPLVRAYYSSIRFPRAWQFLAAGDYERLAIVDVDGVWKTGLDAVFDPVDAGHSVGHLDHPPALPWTRFNASLCLFAADAVGLNWLGQIGRHIAYFLLNGEGRWRLDQCAIYCAWFMNRGPTGTTTPYSLNRFPVEAVRFFKKGDESSGAVDLQFSHEAPTGETETSSARLLAKTYFAKGETARAVSMMRELRSQQPKNVTLRADLAEMLIETGAWEEVRETLGSANSRRVRGLLGDLQVREARQAAERIYTSDSAVKAVDDEQFSGKALLQAMALSFASTGLNTVPCNHRISEGLFPNEVYERLSSGLNDDRSTHWGGNQSYQDRGHVHMDETWREGVWPQITDTLDDPRFIDLVVEYLAAGPLHAAIKGAGCKLIASPNVTMDRRGYSLGPHRDHPVRFASLLIYLPTDEDHPELGTSMYRPLMAMPERDGGTHHSFDLFERISTVPFRPNSRLLFLNFGEAYHGVEPVLGEVYRPMLQITIYIRPDQAEPAA